MVYFFSNALIFFLDVIQYAIMADVLISIVKPKNGNAFVNIIHKFVDIFEEPMRKLQSRVLPNLSMDLSPILAITILWILQTFLQSLVPGV